MMRTIVVVIIIIIIIIIIKIRRLVLVQDTCFLFEFHHAVWRHGMHKFVLTVWVLRLCCSSYCKDSQLPASGLLPPLDYWTYERDQLQCSHLRVGACHLRDQLQFSHILWDLWEWAVAVQVISFSAAISNTAWKLTSNWHSRITSSRMRRLER